MAEKERDRTSVAAIIPARGGSKGIQKKNIRVIAGQPLIAFAIRAAKQAKCISHVYVSTDDPEIAKIARNYGADIIPRPDDLSGDAASSESALLHGLEWLKTNREIEPEVTVFMQCTSPLTTSEDVEATVRVLLKEKADSAFTAAPFHYFIWKKGLQEEAFGVNHDPRVRPRRQDREAQYLETGAVYAFRTQGFRQSRHRFFGKTVFHLVPAERVLEIDDPRDLIVAEALLKEAQRTELAKRIPEPLKGIVFDFDGVFTDNRVLVFEDGREAVICSRGDGWGIGKLKKLGLEIAIISTEKNPVVSVRAKKLEVECFQSCQDKVSVLKQWFEMKQLDPAHVAYVGNDENDVEAMRYVGWAIAVADSHPSAKKVAHLVLSNPGGYGAIRELCDELETLTQHS